MCNEISELVTQCLLQASIPSQSVLKEACNDTVRELQHALKHIAIASSLGTAQKHVVCTTFWGQRHSQHHLAFGRVFGYVQKRVVFARILEST